MNDTLPSRIRNAVELLSNVQMNLSLEDWGRISNAFLDAANHIEAQDVKKRLTDDAAMIERGTIERNRFISGDCRSCKVLPDDAWCTSGPGCVRNKLEESKRA